MSKVYILTDKDFEDLISKLKEDPRYGRGLSEKEERFYSEAHRFYNYRIHRWMEEVKK